jgi:hypothetical protein
MNTGGSYIYYTLAVYSFSYGMTDKRKPEFKISLKIDNNTLSSGYDFSTFYEKYSLPKYYDDNYSYNNQNLNEIDDWEEEYSISDNQ